MDDEDEVHEEVYKQHRPKEKSIPSGIGTTRKTKEQAKSKENSVIASQNLKTDPSLFLVDVSIISMNENNMLYNDAYIDLTPSIPAAQQDSNNQNNPETIIISPAYDDKENMINHYDKNIVLVDDILTESINNDISDQWTNDLRDEGSTNKHDSLLELILNEECNDNSHDLFKHRAITFPTNSIEKKLKTTA